MKQLNLGVAYRPTFADHKLSFKVQVINVTNEQVALQTNPHLFNRPGSAVNSQYGLPLFYQQPRYMQASVSYDF
jgi:outer membrane receptor protein involved in Fe transport